MYLTALINSALLTFASALADAVSEKRTRGLLRSAVQRRLNKRSVLIVDSLNNIKGYRCRCCGPPCFFTCLTPAGNLKYACLLSPAGRGVRGSSVILAVQSRALQSYSCRTRKTAGCCFARYELWCVARTAATRYCMLHCDAPVERARAWNDARRAARAPCYSPAVFEDLARRFETPSERNRWDTPLFRVQPGAAVPPWQHSSADRSDGTLGASTAPSSTGSGAPPPSAGQAQASLGEPCSSRSRCGSALVQSDAQASEVAGHRAGATRDSLSCGSGNTACRELHANEELSVPRGAGGTTCSGGSGSDQAAHAACADGQHSSSAQDGDPEEAAMPGGAAHLGDCRGAPGEAHADGARGDGTSWRSEPGIAERDVAEAHGGETAAADDARRSDGRGSADVHDPAHAGDEPVGGAAREHGAAESSAAGDGISSLSVHERDAAFLHGTDDAHLRAVLQVCPLPVYGPSWSALPRVPDKDESRTLFRLQDLSLTRMTADTGGPGMLCRGLPGRHCPQQALVTYDRFIESLHLPAATGAGGRAVGRGACGGALPAPGTRPDVQPGNGSRARRGAQSAGRGGPRRPGRRCGHHAHAGEG